MTTITGTNGPLEQELWLCARKDSIPDLLAGKFPSWCLLVLCTKPSEASEYFPICECPPFMLPSKDDLLSIGHGYVGELKDKAVRAQVDANEIIRKYESALLMLPAPTEKPRDPVADFWEDSPAPIEPSIGIYQEPRDE